MNYQYSASEILLSKCLQIESSNNSFPKQHAEMRVRGFSCWASGCAQNGPGGRLKEYDWGWRRSQLCSYRMYAFHVFIFQRQTPRSSNLVAIPFARGNVFLKLRVSDPQLHWLFPGWSESNQDAASVEMTLSLDNGFPWLQKCHVSVCFIMVLLFIFFGGNDNFYFCAAFLIVLPIFRR